MSGQKKVFLKSEGDQWFKRNSKLERGELRDNISYFKDFIKDGAKVLEIGSSSGNNVSTLTQASDVSYFGLDPSAEAIEFAKKSYPEHSFVQGVADALPFRDNEFDFVYFGFCLYLVDRQSLCQVVSEADRVLKDGAFLAITDFDPIRPSRRNYKHLKDIYSYKHNYEKMFLGFPHYSLVSKIPQKSLGFKRDEQERASTTILYKEPFPYIDIQEP